MVNSVFLNIAIGDLSKHEQDLQAFERGKEWIKTHGSNYGYTSIDTLEDEDKDTILDIYKSDPALAATGSILLTKPKPLRGGRLVIELFDKDCPKTCENFKQLCIGDKIGKASKKPLRYQGTRIFRVVKDFCFQGGDVTRNDGSGGDSIYNGKFNDEKPGLSKKFDAKGLVAMANSGKNSNTSQFFITLSDKGTKQLEKLNGKYVIFGKVTKGLEVLDAVNLVEVDGETPSADIYIDQAGT
ncbi:hypothetical protein NQZ79_g379 [Umbelopsis isabellina]|nr:hypothetical protein NQZ79_g379 [Umbelopsis isabellina]